MGSLRTSLNLASQNVDQLLPLQNNLTRSAIENGGLSALVSIIDVCPHHAVLESLSANPEQLLSLAPPFR